MSIVEPRAAVGPAPARAGARGPLPDWKIWLLAARPATLPAIVGPVLVGAALGAAQGGFRPAVFAATLIAALLIQVATNFANDVADFERGADDERRLGPLRVTQSGLVTPRQVRLATALTLAAAFLLGAGLVAVGGWPIAVIGVLAVLAALTYTGGPWPYGYHALGEPLVFLFFGVVAVTATAFLQSGRWSMEALLASLPVACTVTAILVVNNLRDLDTDRLAGKRTLAVVLGDRWTRLEHASLMLAPFVLVLAYVVTASAPASTLLAMLALPPAGSVVRDVMRGLRGASLNPVLRRTAVVHLILSVLLSLGWML